MKRKNSISRNPQKDKYLGSSMGKKATFKDLKRQAVSLGMPFPDVVSSSIFGLTSYIDKSQATPDPTLVDKFDEWMAKQLEELGYSKESSLRHPRLRLGFIGDEVGKDIFQKLIKEYTEKQWGRECKDLPAFIIKRLPVRMVYDNNYFNDRYQGIPIGGYNKLIAGLLDGIECQTNVDFFNSEYKEWHKIADRLVYTGAIDEYFDYQLGKLDWRTVSFKTRVEDMPNYQGNAVVNYTSHEQPYTRVIEHKHFEMFGQEVYDCTKTVVSEEYSTEYKPGMEPYYPVNDDRNNQLAEQYRALSAKEKNVIFGGRLAQYKYFDMAPVIEQALNIEL